MMHPPLTEYRGFVIDRFNNIYKDGKEIFTHYTQYNYDLAHAKARIDHSLAEKAKWDLERMADKQAALKKLTTSCELENGAEAADQFTNWMETEADKQLNENL